MKTGDILKIKSAKHVISGNVLTFAETKTVRIVGIHSDIENIAVKDENDVLMIVEKSQIK